MSAIGRLARVLFALCLLLAFSGCVVAADHSSAVETTMRERLVEQGMSARVAARLADENAFIGMVMLRGGEKASPKDLAARAQVLGEALGSVIGETYLSYGQKEIPLVTAAMMNAVRAGIPPQVLAGMFKAMAKNDYPVGRAVSLMHEVSDATGSAGLRDYGVGLCKNIELAAAKKRPYGELQKQVLVAVKLQKALTQQTLLAQAREAEQLRKKAAIANAKKMRSGGSDSGGKDGKTTTGVSASAAGSGVSAGRGEAAGASASGSPSDSGASSGSGSGSSGGAAGSDGAAGSGGNSSGSGSEGSGSGSSGGSDASGGDSSGSGNSDSGNSGGSSGGAGGSDSSDGAGNGDTK